ncbi:MAG TPA: YgiQ family radical SAM protein [Desulfobacteraceae bacterium]|nr:YgiQ family radical SAM protein [Desulfobacteraceae bacterium]
MKKNNLPGFNKNCTSFFLPTTANELKTLGWERPDIILITGDSYIDSPYIGIAVIGKVLQKAGFNTAVIAQPDINSGDDIKRLGEPKLFWGVSGGCIDSLVANYTASKKKRKKDDYTPGGINNRRPDRAVIQYTNLIRRYFKNTVPIVLGGIEASLRRISHYDFWSDKIRKSILFDAKADYLVHGMGEKTAVALAGKLLNKDTCFDDLSGLCYISKQKRDDYIQIPSFNDVKSDSVKFVEMFNLFYQNNDPLTAKGLCQKHDSRYLVQNPPSDYLTGPELDGVHDLEYARDLHPYYKKAGDVRALDTIRFSIPLHRGCYGECNFCAIAVHQGQRVRWRSEKSILKEARVISNLPDFKGIITDAGGPTANMYGFECKKKLEKGSCQDKRCLYPKVCRNLKADHLKLVNLLRKLRSIKGVKHIFIASGIRYDLVFSDKKSGNQYIKEIVNHHVSGQLKIAPEHTEDSVLACMGKPEQSSLLEFKKKFDTFSKGSGKKQFLTYYFIAAHPGCKEADMRKLKKFTMEKLKMNPEQVQIFTPTPSTYSSIMYHTELNPFSGKKIFVEKTFNGREKQKKIIIENGRKIYKKRNPPC